mgnify:CR=1 FL=1
MCAVYPLPLYTMYQMVNFLSLRANHHKLFLSHIISENHSGISYACHFEVNSFAYRSWTLTCLTQRHSSCMKHLSATSCLKSTANLNSRTTPPYGIPSKIYTWNCFTCITESVSSFSMYRLVSNNCIVNNSPTGRKFSLEFKFRYFACAEFANFLLLYFKNLSMMAYKILKYYQNSLIFNSVNLTFLSQVAKLNSVYIFIL